MNKLFIINGSGGCGKDTFVTFVREILEKRGYATTNVSAIDRVVELAEPLGYNGGKTERDRRFLKEFRDLLEWYGDVPFKDVTERLKCFYGQYKGDAVAFLHCREPKNIERYIDYFTKGDFVICGEYSALSVSTILVRNPNVPTISSNESDANVENFCYDVTVANDGTKDDLQEKAERFCRWV